MEVVRFGDNETRMISIHEEGFMNDLQISCISPVSSSDLSDQDDTSIRNHVEQLNQLFTSQNLELAKSDMDRLQTELDHQRTKYEEVKDQLHEKEEDLAKMKLERDLADAESKLLKDQFIHLKDKLENSATNSSGKTHTWKQISFHQFTPGFNQSDGWPCCEVVECDMSGKLLNWWKKQEKLHRWVVKDLRRKAREKKVISDIDPYEDSPRHCCLLSFTRRFRVQSPYKVIRFSWSDFFRKGFQPIYKRTKKIVKSFSESKLKYTYQAMSDNDATAAVSYDDKNSIHNREIMVEQEDADPDLIEEILSVDEENRKLVTDFRRYLASQNREINDLKNEVARLSSFQIAVASPSSDSSDDEESFFTTAYSVVTDFDPIFDGAFHI